MIAHDQVNRHDNSTIIFTGANENLTQFIKVLLVKVSKILDSSKFIRLFHCQSFALYGTYSYFSCKACWKTCYEDIKTWIAIISCQTLCTYSHTYHIQTQLTLILFNLIGTLIPSYITAQAFPSPNIKRHKTYIPNTVIVPMVSLSR